MLNPLSSGSHETISRRSHHNQVNKSQVYVILDITTLYHWVSQHEAHAFIISHNTLPIGKGATISTKGYPHSNTGAQKLTPDLEELFMHYSKIVNK